MSTKNLAYGLKEGIVTVFWQKSNDLQIMNLVYVTQIHKTNVLLFVDRLHLKEFALFDRNGNLAHCISYEECNIEIQEGVFLVIFKDETVKIAAGDAFDKWKMVIELLLNENSIFKNEHLRENAEEMTVGIRKLKIINAMLPEPLPLDKLFQNCIDFLCSATFTSESSDFNAKLKSTTKELNNVKTFVNEKIECLDVSIEDPERKKILGTWMHFHTQVNQLVKCLVILHKKYTQYLKLLSQNTEKSETLTLETSEFATMELLKNFNYTEYEECVSLINCANNLCDICHSVLSAAESKNLEKFEELGELSKRKLYDLLKSVHSILSTIKSFWIGKNLVNVLKTFHQGWNNRLRVAKDSFNSSTDLFSVAESVEYINNSIKILKKNILIVMRLKDEEIQMGSLLKPFEEMEFDMSIKSQKLVSLVTKMIRITQEFFFTGKTDNATVQNFINVIKKMKNSMEVLLSKDNFEGENLGVNVKDFLRLCTTIKQYIDNTLNIFENLSENDFGQFLMDFNEITSNLYKVLKPFLSIIKEGHQVSFSTEDLSNASDAIVSAADQTPRLKTEYFGTVNAADSAVAVDKTTVVTARDESVLRSDSAASSSSTESKVELAKIDKKASPKSDVNTNLLASTDLTANQSFNFLMDDEMDIKQIQVKTSRSMSLPASNSSLNIIKDIYPEKMTAVDEVEMVEYTVPGTNLPPLLIPKTLNVWDEPMANVIYQDELESITPSELTMKFNTKSSISSLALSEERVLRLASINHLIIHLTDYKRYNQEFSDIFLNTFNSFMTPEHLWVKLLERYNISDSISLKRKERMKNQLHLLVLNIIVKWLKTQPWTIKKSLMSHIEYFADTSLMKDGFTQGRTKLKNLLLEVQRENEMENETPKSLNVYKKLDTHKRLNLLDESFDLKKVAQQFTLLDWDLFSQIKPMDLIRSTGKEKPFSIQRCTNRFNEVSSWVAYSILQEESLTQRAKLYSKLINFAKVLYSMKNFNSCMAIISGFNNSAVHRLYQTQLMLSKKDVSTREYLNQELSSDNSYKRYRQIITQTIPPLVPFLGVFLTDLLFIEEGNKDVINGLINFHKRRMQYRVMSILQGISQTTLEIPPDPELLSIVSDLECASSERELYRLSLIREPRMESKDKKISQLKI